MTDLTGRIKVLKNKVKHIAKYITGKIKSMFFVERETLCDNEIAD